MRVLLPTDDPEIIPALVEGYQQLGHEVVTGKRNFFLRASKHDLVHFLWPEEFTEWREPSRAKLDFIRECLDWWCSNSRTMVSVNNLYPHCHEDSALFKALYEMFYARCDTILHHSRTSKELVNEAFPVSARRRNVVGTMFNYDRYLPARLDREGARRSFGFNPKEFVLLVFGALRKTEEILLIYRAYARAKVAHKRLLMAGRYRAGSRRKIFLWNMWLKSIRAVSVKTFIPEDDVHRYIEASDAIMIPRLNDLSSGVVGLGGTFGRVLIAPNHGSFPDYLAGTDNLLFNSGDPDSLAESIERASRMDREAAGRKNRKMADSWTWKRILEPALLGESVSPTSETLATLGV
jgi:Glycosyl transferases group 1